MKNRLEPLFDNLENDEALILGEQTFVDEIASEKLIQCSVLRTITFCHVDFKKVDFTGKTFINSKFENVIFSMHLSKTV